MVGRRETRLHTSCPAPRGSGWSRRLRHRLRRPALGARRRLFWTDDQRFLKQFRAGSLSTRFKPYSKFPPCLKDVSFWTNDRFTENNLCEIVRGIAGGLIAGGMRCVHQHGCSLQDTRIEISRRSWSRTHHYRR